MRNQLLLSIEGLVAMSIRAFLNTKRANRSLEAKAADEGTIEDVDKLLSRVHNLYVALHRGLFFEPIMTSWQFATTPTLLILRGNLLEEGESLFGGQGLQVIFELEETEVTIAGFHERRKSSIKSESKMGGKKLSLDRDRRTFTIWVEARDDRHSIRQTSGMTRRPSQLFDHFYCLLQIIFKNKE
jgi:hypothetical protein